ncbi:hypothetical protein L1049_001873 [Liquidambar formosana]|uniref:Uncharacterized protein n=1 Tax=Liquidambar formosana TaxID=63359 RepID=A0AAP0R8I9_LIQFO
MATGRSPSPSASARHFEARHHPLVYSHGPEVPTADLDRVIDSHFVFLEVLLSYEVSSKNSDKAKYASFQLNKSSISIFAATLEREDATDIAKHLKVLLVFLNQGRRLHTTHSCDFIFTPIPCGKARFGEDTIIGNLHTDKSRIVKSERNVANGERADRIQHNMMVKEQ